MTNTNRGVFSAVNRSHFEPNRGFVCCLNPIIKHEHTANIPDHNCAKTGRCTCVGQGEARSSTRRFNREAPAPVWVSWKSTETVGLAWTRERWCDVAPRFRGGGGSAVPVVVDVAPADRSGENWHRRGRGPDGMPIFNANFYSPCYDAIYHIFRVRTSGAPGRTKMHVSKTYSPCYDPIYPSIFEAEHPVVVVCHRAVPEFKDRFPLDALGVWMNPL